VVAQGGVQQRSCSLGAHASTAAGAGSAAAARASSPSSWPSSCVGEYNSPHAERLLWRWRSLRIRSIALTPHPHPASHVRLRTLRLVVLRPPQAHDERQQAKCEALLSARHRNRRSRRMPRTRRWPSRHQRNRVALRGVLLHEPGGRRSQGSRSRGHLWERASARE
jgi:hypothetical protein